jgi:hypothetical protein
MTNLSTLSLSQLVALHNQHAAKPVKKFSDRATGIKRTAAVLPNKARGEAKRLSLHGRFLAAVGDRPFVASTIAQELGVTEKAVRSCVEGGQGRRAQRRQGAFRVVSR